MSTQDNAVPAVPQDAQPVPDVDIGAPIEVAGTNRGRAYTIEEINRGVERVEKSRALKKFPLTESGNAERLVARFGRAVRYCHTWGEWLMWDKKRWRRDDKRSIYTLAKMTARSIPREYTPDGSEEENTKAKKAIHAFARRSESRTGLAAMIELAQTSGEVAVRSGQLDKEPYLFNCQNGTLDLRTGELRPHTQEDLLTKIAPVEYHPDAPCPRWLQFLDEVFMGDKALIGFMQRVLGCALSGVYEKAAFFLVGRGDNGKTTLVEVIRDILGYEYAGTININLLMQSRDDNNQLYATAKLEGKRFVTASETKEGKRLDEQLIKQLTGGGRINARHPYGGPFEFDPQFKLFVDANHMPEIHGTEHAIWQRIQEIPFNRTFTKQEKDEHLRAKLHGEAAGILAWLVQGYLERQRDGLNPPAAVTEAVAAHREEMDVVGHFITDQCVLDPDAETSATNLYTRFDVWCREHQGIRWPMKNNGFSRRLTEKQFPLVRNTQGVWVRRGLRLRGAML